MSMETRDADQSKRDSFLERFNPALPKRWLLIISGLMWAAVGVMLLRYAVSWLAVSFSVTSILLGLLGVILSIAANRFMFARISRKNVNRILALKDKACLFSFQAWSGYLIIIVMMTGGILMRNSAFPKPYLAVIYATIGGALAQASLNYFKGFFSSANSAVI